MKLKEWSLTDLFKQFIRDSYSGKRMRKDGKKLNLKRSQIMKQC